ncbi:MAG TPA: hypothetical protein VKB93_28005 [Thermoanaerobaculia bacterium]|nr:hypothetical protein [Thermoanaerobaculia bacterium]
MPADARFLTRAYREGDETAILDLFARAFPHAPRRIEHFRWKYRENPFGNARISLTFGDPVTQSPGLPATGEPGDRATGQPLLAHYAGYAVPFRAFGRDLLAHQIGDTMTDVLIRHVGRGPTSILGRTALHFYENFCDGQVAFNYGFNVSNIHKFSLRFLRADRVEAVTYRIAKPPLPISRWQRRLGGYQLELVNDVDEEWDAFFERVENDYRFLVRRNARYVRWRYLDAPDTRYSLVTIRKWRRLIGWIAFRVEGDRFLWGDALFDRRFPGAVEVMLRHVVPSHPVTRIEAWFPPRPAWFDEVLHDLGFEARPEPQDLSVMCVPFSMPGATAAMREALYYSWGDSDLF